MEGGGTGEGREYTHTYGTKDDVQYGHEIRLIQHEECMNYCDQNNSAPRYLLDLCSSKRKYSVSVLMNRLKAAKWYSGNCGENLPYCSRKEKQRQRIK
jgi:hypothetical protein